MIFLKNKKKKKQEYDISSNMLKRWSFQRGPLCDMILLVLSWKMVFFSRKHDNFSIGRKMRDDLSQEIHGNMIFLCIRTGVTNLVPRPSVKKNQRWSYPAKIHLKVIDVLDWHSRKSSNNSQYFHGDLYKRFHYCSAARKKNAKKKQWIISNTL